MWQPQKGIHSHCGLGSIIADLTYENRLSGYFIYLGLPQSVQKMGMATGPHHFWQHAPLIHWVSTMFVVVIHYIFKVYNWMCVCEALRLVCPKKTFQILSALHLWQQATVCQCEWDTQKGKPFCFQLLMVGLIVVTHRSYLTPWRSH